MTDIRRPWSLDPGSTPVERILGREFAGAGPLGLLGLSAEACSPDDIARALARQLERVNEHPHATSHEADEVRLSLHAAAAQLVDPRTRDAMIAASLAARSWARPKRPFSPVAIAMARGEIRRTLGRYGGLNARSIRFLVLVADKHGIAREHLAEAVRACMRDPARESRQSVRAATGPRPQAAVSARAVAARTQVPRPGAPHDDEIDPAVRTLRLILILGAVGVVTVALAIVAVWLIARGLTPGTANPPAPPPIASTQRDPSAKPPDAPGPTGTSVPTSATAATPVSADPVAECRRLLKSVEDLSGNPDTAVTEFTGALERLASLWPELTPDRLAAAQDSVVEFLYRAGNRPEIGLRATQAICAGSQSLRLAPAPIAQDHILPGIWSVGTLSRLARERELPAQIRAVIDSELALSMSGAFTGGSGSFNAGAGAALLAMPRLMVRAGTEATPAAIVPTSAFDLWLRAARSVAGTDEHAADRFALAGLETVLSDGPDPDPGSPAASVVLMLTTSISWRADGDARTRLIRWFDSRSISSTDLNAVTSALAAGSAAAGVDATMVLTTRADLPQRQELRDRYLASWSLKDQGAVDALVAEWAKQARQYAAPDDHPGTSTEQLARAALLARINLAGTLLHAGLSAEPGEVLRALEAPITGALASVGSGGILTSLDDGGSDGSWAIRYLAADKNIPQRAALLSELGHGPAVLGQVDADVLAGEAFRGSPVQVRRSAADLMVKFSSSPAVLNAALEQAPFLPRNQDASELVRKISLGRVPPIRDPDWRTGVRRALVERLLQMLAARGDEHAVDDLADVMADAYAGRASVGAVDRPPASGEKQGPEHAARAVRLAWERWGAALTPSGREPLNLDQIRRRHSGRAGLSDGLVQAFAAEQVTTAELMAYVIANERPDAAAQVREIVDRLARARREAEHVFAQILACERAMTELLMIRLEVGQS